MKSFGPVDCVVSVFSLLVAVFLFSRAFPRTGKSCFSNRALVKAIFEAPKCLQIVMLRPQHGSRLKPYY